MDTNKDINKSKKRLFRSETDKVFFGICGGIAEYFDIDAVLIRLVWIVVTVLSGGFPGVLVYLVAPFVIPRSPNANLQ